MSSAPGLWGPASPSTWPEAASLPLILEQYRAASQSTSRSGAMVRMHYTNAPEASMALTSLTYFRDWDGHVGAGSCGFVQTGFLVLVAADQVEKLRRNTERLRQLGVVTEVVWVSVCARSPLVWRPATSPPRPTSPTAGMRTRSRPRRDSSPRLSAPGPGCGKGPG